MVDENSVQQFHDEISSPLSSSPPSSTTSSTSSMSSQRSDSSNSSHSDTNSTNLTPTDYSSDEESLHTNRRVSTADDINELIGKASEKLSKQQHNGTHRHTRADMDLINRFFELMKSERNRLVSFTVRENSKWTLEHVIPAKHMARAGFFYLNADRVQCVFCRGIVRNWDSGLRPMAEHARHFPRCPFIMQVDVGNVPIDDDPVRGPQYEYGRDVCGNRDPTYLFNNVNIVRNNTNEQNNLVNKTVLNGSDNKIPLIDIKQYGIQPYSGPKNISMSSADARLQSFVNRGWDNSIPVSVDKLVEAGFYYSGRSDAVLCFYCNGGLMSWVKGDEPWVEHAKKLPVCHFLQLNKGQNFIDECQRLEAIERQRSAEGLEEAHAIEGNGDDLSVCNIVEQWMNGQLVKRLVELNSFSTELIKATLNQRYRTHRRMFDTFDELYETVKQSECPNVFNVISLPPPEQQTPSPSSSSVSPLSEPLSNSSSDLNVNTCAQTPIPTPSTTQQHENRLQCKLCFVNEIGVVFLPCGHQLACIECAQRVYECPICRKQLRGFVKTFFS